MDHFDEKIDELLAKHLAGESSPEEETAITDWLDESPTHRKYLTDLQWLWQHSPGGKTQVTRPVDTEAALTRVKTRLKTGGGPASALRWQRGFWMRAAAVFLVVLAAVYWWQNSQTTPPQYIAAAHGALTDTLSDGSHVRLEQNSGLAIAANFNRSERRMRLQGEAYFKVTPDTSRPFVVEVLDLQVRVVGTAFTVDNITDPSNVLVRVSEGKVLVSSKRQSLLLLAGEQAVYDTKNGLLTRSFSEQGTPGTMLRTFRFEATTLAAVVRQLNLAYNARISIKNKVLENCLLTARFNDLPLERVLEIVAESFSIRVEKTAEGYVLDGTGCGE